MATNTDGREEIKPVAPTEQTKWRDPSLVGKYMVDPKTGLAGLFRSPDNGETWVLTDTVYGHVYNQDEVDNIWDNGAAHKVADEIKSATADLPNVRKQADEAVKFAESAIAASKVNSDAIVAQSSAVIEAKSAMDSATAEIQQTAANAASDAAKIRADVARVQNEVDTAKAANSASVEALKSDVSAAKQDLADVHDSLTKAQSAIEQNQKLINNSVAKITSDVSATKQDLATVHDSLTKAQAAAEQNQKAINDSIAEINANVDATNQDLAGVRKDLTKAQSDITANQKSINNNVAQINSDIAQDRKDIASAQQVNADTAKQLDTYSKQAAEQGKTIKSIQDKQDGFTATLADVQGNVSQVSDKVDGLSANLKDAQDNVASVKAQADQLSATLTDHAKSIATLTASAKELSSTLEDADGRLSKVEQTAQTNSSTFADMQGDLSQVKQDATTLTATLKDAQGNISTLQQKADSVSAQLASAQGDIATLQTGVAGVKATLASHDKSIHTLQLDSKSLKDSMADAQGDISALSKTATSLDSEMKDHAGRLSKVEQSAATQATTLSDLQGNLSQVKQQADGLVTTLKDAQGDITQIQQKADGTLAQLKSAQGDIASLQTDVTGIKATLISHEGDIHTLQADSKTLKDDMTDAQGNISSLQKSSTKLDSEMSSQDGRLSKVEQTAQEHTTTISDLGDKLSNMKVGGRNLATGTGQEYVMGYGIPNTTWQNGYAYEKLPATVTVHEILPQNDQFHANLVPGQEYTQTIWFETDADAKKLNAAITWYNDTTGHDQQPAKIIKIGENSYKLFSTYTWPGKTDNNVRLFDTIFLDGAFDLATGTYLKFGKLKLETGNTSTDWTPAPEDLATVTQVKQTADGIETTLKSAQGDIDQIKQTAKGTSEQLADVQGNVTSIQKDVDGLKQTTADNAGNIHTLQSDSKTLKDDMQDAQGDISTLKKTSTDVTSELKDHAGRISKTEQTANTLTNEFSDQQGRLNKVEQTADGTQQTVANQQGQINTIKTDTAGIHETLTGQGNQITNINVTLNGLNTKYEGVSGDLNKLKSQAQWVTVTSAVDLNNVKTPCREFLKGTVTNAPNETAWWYLTVESSDDGNRVTQTVIADQSNNRYTRRWADVWSAWVKDATQTDVTALSDRITTNSTQITQNKQAIALKADQSSVDNLSGEVSQNKAQFTVQAGQISSKVSGIETSLANANSRLDSITSNGGGRNLLRNSTNNGSKFQPNFSKIDNFIVYTASTAYMEQGQQYTVHADASNGLVWSGTHDPNVESNKVVLWLTDTKTYWQIISDSNTATGTTFTWNHPSGTYYLRVNTYKSDNSGYVERVMLEKGVVAHDWQPAPEDTDAKITANSTAIDQTNKKISLKADQTEVDQVKQTATQNSSRLDVMAGQISSKVTSTDVNNIVNGKGYATTSTVQSLVDQKAGTINESITNLEGKFNSSSSVNLAEKTNQGITNWSVSPGDGTTTISEVNINGIRGVRFTQTKKSTTWWVITYNLNLDYFEPNQDYIISFDVRTSSDNFAQDVILNIARGDSSHAYLANTSFRTNFKKNQLTHVSCTGHSYSSLDKNGETFYLNCLGLGQCDWVDIVNLKIARGTIDKGYSPAPSDNATVTQVQSLTASIDGLQSTVANKADKSQITQLSNVIQSKVSSSDFNDLKDKTLWKSTDSIDLNTAVSQQKIFVKGGSNLPPGGYWWYVQVAPGYDSRIVQYAVSDRDNIHYSRQYDGKQWTSWSQGATESEITQLRDDINLRVKSGDLLSQINIQAGRTLIQSQKIYMDADSVIMGPNTRAFIPSAAIVNLDVAKLNAGTINTDRIHIGDDSVYLSVKNNYLRLDGSNTKDKYQLRLTGNDIEFADNDSSNWEYRIQHGIAKYQTDEDGLDFDVYSKRGGANHTVMAVSDAGVMISPSLFFQTDGIDSSNWMGFTRNTVDGNTTVSFHTWDDNNEGFHVDCGARFMNYVYINGYARAQGWLTNSTLSKKTNIRKLDNQIALDKIRQDDQYLYEYKRNVAKGIYDPQASFIIDDVNDVAQYSVPREFIDQTGNYREPNVELAYLVAAFQALDKQVQEQNETIKKLEAKLNE